MKYRIWCTVSGGITGRREAWLKEGGKIYETSSEARAKNKAKHLNDTMGKNSMASFHYSVVNVK